MPNSYTLSPAGRKCRIYALALWKWGGGGIRLIGKNSLPFLAGFGALGDKISTACWAKSSLVCSLFYRQQGKYLPRALLTPPSPAERACFMKCYSHLS